MPGHQAFHLGNIEFSSPLQGIRFSIKAQAYREVEVQISKGKDALRIAWKGTCLDLNP